MECGRRYKIWDYIDSVPWKGGYQTWEELSKEGTEKRKGKGGRVGVTRWGGVRQSGV